MGMLLEHRWFNGERLKGCQAAEVIVLALLMAYFTLSRTLLKVPMCPFAYLGLRCPTCGTTRAVWNIMHGNFSAAWSLNPIGFLVVFLFLRRLEALTFRIQIIARLLANQIVDLGLIAGFLIFGFMKMLRLS